jgi:hypothetical protein
MNTLNRGARTAALLLLAAKLTHVTACSPSTGDDISVGAHAYFESYMNNYPSGVEYTIDVSASSSDGSTFTLCIMDEENVAKIQQGTRTGIVCDILGQGQSW